ncbi:hypothetical protein [Streptomyces sp. YIM 98790]|uniref:hypothetical protein n=1 Tax=Streptomyces sp. YIM 98790 TaxID=2689077 RepID=UPI001A9CDD97|nr:hypothetical protein [Streptomyces sp. YIM 98790]
MDSATYLLPEDQPEFERILDEALRRARSNPQFPGYGDSFDAERLRSMALDAIPLIAPAADAEYRRFVRLREQFGRLTERNTESSRRSSGQADGGGAGSGLAALVAVLVPVLSGVAAVVFLVSGYALRLAGPEPSVAAGMRTTGWVFAVLTGVGVLAAAVILFGTALRNGATAEPAGRAADAASRAAAELERARAEWRRALLERGMNPFLRNAAAAWAGREGRAAAPPRESRTPRLSFTSPSFTSPSEGREAPEGRVGDRSAAGFPHPRYSSPGYSSHAESDDNHAER